MPIQFTRPKNGDKIKQTSSGTYLFEGSYAKPQQLAGYLTNLKTDQSFVGVLKPHPTVKNRWKYTFTKELGIKPGSYELTMVDPSVLLSKRKVRFTIVSAKGFALTDPVIDYPLPNDDFHPQGTAYGTCAHDTILGWMIPNNGNDPNNGVPGTTDTEPGQNATRWEVSFDMPPGYENNNPHRFLARDDQNNNGDSADVNITAAEKKANERKRAKPRKAKA